MVIDKSEFENRRDNWLQKGIKVNPSSATLLPNSQHMQSRIIKFPTRSKQRFSRSIQSIKDEELPRIITDELRQKLLSNPKLAHLYVVRAQRERINNPSPEANNLCKEYEELYIKAIKLKSNSKNQKNNKKSNVGLTH